MPWLDSQGDFWGRNPYTGYYEAIVHCVCHGWLPLGKGYDGYTFEDIFNLAGAEWTDEDRPVVNWKGMRWTEVKHPNEIAGPVRP